MVGKEALESILKDYQGTILFVSHDRYFVKSVATCLFIFDNGKVDFYLNDYETYIANRSIKEEQRTNIKLRNTQNKDAITFREQQKQTQKKERRLIQLETEIAEQEQLVEKWKKKFLDPEIAANFEKLDEINKLIETEEEKLNNLMMEWSGLT